MRGPARASRGPFNATPVTTWICVQKIALEVTQRGASAPRGFTRIPAADSVLYATRR